MGKHADKLRELVENDLHKWVRRYAEDGAVDVNGKVVAMGVYANAKHLLEKAIALVAASEPVEAPP